MSLRLFACLSLLLVPLSGCIAGVGTMSAESGLNDATKHVEDLLDNDITPVLIGVASVEPFKHYLEKDGDYEFEVNTYADATQGDGKIPAWAYAYCVGEDLVIVFLAAGIGPLADFRESDQCDDDVQEYAIEGWEIDSDEAADILADHPDWPEPREDSMTVWLLGQMPGEDGESFPAWFVETDTLDWEDEDHYAVAVVNARTGEIVELSDEYPDYGGDIIFGETGASQQDCIEVTVDDEDTGVITALEGLVVSIDLPAPGNLLLTIQASNTVLGPTFTLEGPDGEVTSGTAEFYSIVGVDDQPAGQYTLTVDTDTVDDVRLVLEGTYCS